VFARRCACACSAPTRAAISVCRVVGAAAMCVCVRVQDDIRATRGSSEFSAVSTSDVPASLLSRLRRLQVRHTWGGGKLVVVVGGGGARAGYLALAFPTCA
jgi:hypothetical protein